MDHIGIMQQQKADIPLEQETSRCSIIEEADEDQEILKLQKDLSQDSKTTQKLSSECLMSDQEKEKEREIQELEDINNLHLQIATQQKEMMLQTQNLFFQKKGGKQDQQEQKLTYHRQGVLVYDQCANIKLLGDQQPSAAVYFMGAGRDKRKQSEVEEFYSLDVDKIRHKKHTPTTLKNLKKLAPNNNIDSCSKEEAKIFKSLPKFNKKKDLTSQALLYDLYVPPSQSVTLFNSRFESGNLKQAIRTSDNSYQLYLDYDTNSQNHTQWFYFSCKGSKQGQSIDLSIMNLMKVDSLFNQGMQVCIFSKRKFQDRRVTWHRGCQNISYRKSEQGFSEFFSQNAEEQLQHKLASKQAERGANIPNNKEESYEVKRVFYRLNFSYTFEYDDDIVFFSHFFPYTHRDLEMLLEDASAKPKIENILRVDTLCESLAGNPCYILTVTSSVKTYLKSQDEQKLLNKSDAARAMMKKKLEMYEA